MRISTLITFAALMTLSACEYFDGDQKDNDGDGWTEAEGDCDDEDASTYLGALEVCDGISNDCDDIVDEGLSCVQDPQGSLCDHYVYRDADGDGYGDPLTAYCMSSEDRPAGWVFVDNADDCDDGDAELNPGMAEICDDIDNDCNGEIDDIDIEADAEDIGVEEYFPDDDDDGYGDPDAAMVACEMPDGYVEDSGDCDDSKPSMYPGNSEVCDGLDNDCNGSVDDDAEDADEWWPDDDDDGYGDEFAASVIDCDQPQGYVDNNDDCDDAKSAIKPGATETCDGLDNDCDGSVDEDAGSSLMTWYRDGDRDGYGSDDPSDALEACSQPADYVANNDDCDDGRSDVYPGAPEYCDAVDHDCDSSTTDDAVDQDSWPVDSDGDGFGHKTEVKWGCTQPAGTVEDNTDCNDQSFAINPDADEICDHKDNDCDLAVDDADDDVENQQVRWKDQDGDDFGAGTALELCFPSESTLTLVANNDDCDDSDADIFPGADEVCDHKDNDCDGVSDEDDAIDAETWYADTDGDGHGDASSTKVACDPPPQGFVSIDNDCDDTQDDVYPGAEEFCNGIDDDCNDEVDDDASDALAWHLDADHDGFGNEFEIVWECVLPSGYVDDSLEFDCKDTNDTVYPGATEICDGLDNDCDGTADEGLKTRWYRDADGDGFGISSTSKLECTRPAGYSGVDGDCNDSKPLVHPGAYERCNSLDDDCDGLIDENPVCDPVDTGVIDTGSFDTGSVDTGDSAIDTADTGSVPADFTIECHDSGGGYMDITVENLPKQDVTDVLVYSWNGLMWLLVKDEPYANDLYQVSVPLENFFLVVRLDDGREVDLSLQDLESLTPSVCAPEYHNSGGYWYVWYLPMP